MRERDAGVERLETMFLYYNNRAGCVRSLLVSLLATLVLSAIVWIINSHR
jgi:hypothetical protein